VEFSTIIESALETSRPVMAAAGHEFTVELPETPIWLDADPARLTQVFSNLLNNAAKYTPPAGHIWLVVEHKAGQLEVRVRDNGIGIAADVLPHIFQMFMRAESAASGA